MNHFLDRSYKIPNSITVATVGERRNGG